MKRFLLIPILLGSIIFAGCSQKQGLSQDELFEKKQECSSMKEEIQKEQIKGISVSEVFYSKKMNTCLYVLKGNGKKFIIDRFGDEFQGIYNANSELFCEEIFGNIKDNDVEKALKKCLKESKEFDKKLKELKGE